MNFLTKYKSIWLFLLRFFGAYILGVLIYNAYLNQFVTEVDTITRMVTEQVASLLSLTLPDISSMYSDVHPIAEIRYMGVTLVLLIEGCNAISVMILFVAFLVAFKGKTRNLLWFAPIGILILYLANLVRIYLIGMIILYFPNWTNMAHDYVFPGVIYGTTFLLWVVWVKYFSIRN